MCAWERKRQEAKGGIDLLARDPCFMGHLNGLMLKGAWTCVWLSEQNGAMRIQC